MIYFATFSLIGLLVIPIGIILDRHPLKRTLKVLLLALFISQVTVAFLFTVVPPYFLPMVYILRSLFGLAGEGLFTAQCTIISIYAEGQYELLAGLSLAIPFVFDALNSVTTTAIYKSTQSVPLCWWVGCFFCLLSVGTGFILINTILSK